MKKSVNIKEFMKAFYDAWDMNIGLSEIPSLLGVSRPTYYKFLNYIVNKLNISIKFIPNVYALGCRLLFIETQNGRANFPMHGLDLGSMKRITIHYIKEEESELQIQLFRAIGLKVQGPYVIDSVFVPFKRAEYRAQAVRPRLSELEKRLIHELSKEFLNTRELAKRLGISWQRVSWLIQQPRVRLALVSPLISESPNGNGTIGVLINLRRRPNINDVSAIFGNWPSILVSNMGDPPYILIGVINMRKLLLISKDVDNLGITKIMISHSYPLPPVAVDSKEAVVRQVLKREQKKHA